MVGVGRLDNVPVLCICKIGPVDWACKIDPVDWGCRIEGCVGTVAEGGGESSQSRSLMASGTAGCAALAPTEPRIDGGMSDVGMVFGISLPASLPWIRCMATANPSRVRRPSLFRSAKSLEIFQPRTYCNN